MPFIQGIIAIISIFVVTPSIVFGFILLSKKEKNRLDALRYQKELAEIELRRDELKLRLLEAENAKYDRLIEAETKRN